MAVNPTTNKRTIEAIERGNGEAVRVKLVELSHFVGRRQVALADERCTEAVPQTLLNVQVKQKRELEDLPAT